MNPIEQKFRNQKLSGKLAILSVGLGAIVLVISVTFQASLSRYEMRRDLKVSIEQYVSLARPNIEDALTKGDSEELKRNLLALSQIRQVSSVDFSHQTAMLPQHLSYSKPEAAYFVSAGEQFYFSIGEPENSGELRIFASEDPFLERTSLALISSFTANIVIVLSVTLGLLYFVRRLLLRHLKKIANFAREISVENHSESLTLDRAQKRQSNDELDYVVNAIEQMRKQLIEDLDQRRAIELALIAEKEEKLETRRAIENAQASDRAKSQFIATMSHEIRTPMNGVIGMVEMLRSTELDKEQVHYLDVISRSGETLMSIINDILDYSKIEAGKMTLEQIDFNLEVVINDCLQLFAGTAHMRSLNLMGNIAPNAPLNLVGDPTRLKQVLVNLIGNAFKFTSTGYVFINVNVLYQEHESSISLHFSVQDSGIGISNEVQSNIFDAFKQADNTTTRKYGGTGLGLAICKQLVELMGGRIGLSSKVDYGSTFWFTAKFTNCDSSVVEPQSCSLSLSGKSLLHVHPRKFLHDALKAHADASNLHLTEENDAEVAYTHLQEGKYTPDFILLPHSADEFDGIKYANSIRSLKRFSDTPILMTTSEQVSSFDLNDIQGITTLLKLPLCVHDIVNALQCETSGISLNELIPSSPGKGSKKVNLQVLVAEDNLVNRMVIEGLLDKFNIKPDFSENGKEAVERYTSLEKKYDLIFMDCEMPEMDGFEATLRIREWEGDRGSPHVPIIALTAHVEPEHRKKVVEVGMNYYVSKPVTLDKLSQALSTVGLR